MPITKSAKKALRQSFRRRAQNRIHKNKIKNLIKEVRDLVTQNKKKEAQSILPKLYKALDKAAKTGVIKKNTAARRKSRITKFVTGPSTKQTSK